MKNLFKNSVIPKELFGDIFNGIKITITVSNTKRTAYCEKTQRLTDEKYILNISHKAISIECSGEKSAFYALCDLEKRINENKLTSGEYVCSPSFRVRGYIEGFYGTPWSHNDRISVMSLMAKNRMNTVYYAPKDDKHHRDLWREAYPEDELKKIRELSALANSLYMDFYWCIAPGLSMKYCDKAEFIALTNKTKQLYSIGIRNFGLLLDDINDELEFAEDRAVFAETVNAHIDLINRYYDFLKSLDNSIKLTVCPTLYHGKGNEYYISKLGQNISPLVSVFWTGKDICSRELTSFDALKFIENTRHKPLFWDNYPVNDCSMYNEMHISPIINRDADLYKYSEGIISNCMEYPECSKIPLITFADYLWDSENYAPQYSWKQAVRQVTGKENAEIFTVFADHLYTSCLKDSNSRQMYEVLDKIEIALKYSDKQKAFCIAQDYLNKMNSCREFLKSDLPVCKELKKWSEKFFIGCDIADRVFEFIKTENQALITEISALIEKYDASPARLSNDINIRSELKTALGINI